MKLDKAGFSETQKIFLWVLATAICFVAMLAFDRSLPFEIFWISLILFCSFFVLFKFVNSRNETISEAEIDSTYQNSRNYKFIMRRSEPEKNDDPYDEAQLFIFVSNGEFSGTVDIYADIQELKKIGEALSGFPNKIGDEYCYTYGSSDPVVNFYRLFQIKAYTIGSTGRCGIQFEIDLNTRGLGKTYSIFSIVVYPAEVMTLSRLLVNFAELRHMELQWSSTLNNSFEKWQTETGPLFSKS